MTTHYQPILSAHFASGFAPDVFQRAGIDQVIFDRCADIVQIAYGWSEDAAMVFGHEGFGIADLATAFRTAFKGKRGVTVGKVEDYKDPNPETPVNTRFIIRTEGDGWWTSVAVYAEVEFGEGETESENEVRYLDRFDSVVIQSGMGADDKASYDKMVRWWTSVNPSKAEG